MNQTEKLCEYNFQCEDYAADGTWADWDYKIDNNGPAKFHVVFHDKEQDCDFEYDICGGCLGHLQFEDDDPDFETISIKRIAAQTKTYDGKRSTKTRRVHQLWTQEEKDAAIASLRKRVVESGGEQYWLKEKQLKLD